MTAAATKMGVIMGTAAYMSPEQAKGKTADRRSDVWAFGVVLYEMLAGRRAFVGDDVSDTLVSVFRDDPDWSRLSDDVPARVRQAIQVCLQKEPRQRVRDIAAVRLAMEGAFETTVTSPTELAGKPTLQVWQRPVVALGIVVFAVLIAGLAVWSLTRPGPQAVTRFEIPLRPEQTFAGVGRHLVAVSPDGRQILYVTSDGLSLRSLDQVAPVLVAGTDGSAREPFFSPDGQWIGFYAGSALRKVATSGGAPVTLGDAESPYGASWGADDMILYGGPEGIWRVPGTSGTPEAVIGVEEGERALHGPQMLPGGEWILFTLAPRGAVSWEDAQIVVQSVETGERVVLIEGGRDARYVSTGHLVYGVNNVLFAVSFDLDTRAVIGGAVPLVEDVRDAGQFTGAMHFSIAGNGSLVYVPGGAGAAEARTLVWVDRQGREEPVGAPPRPYYRPRVSPDGTRLAVEVVDPPNPDVWIYDLARGTSTRLTVDEAVDSRPLWTPNGERVVFSSTREGDQNLFWRAADATGPVERLTTSPDAQSAFAWAGDGQQLVFAKIAPNRSSDFDIWVLSLGESTPEPLIQTPFRESIPAVSPDGRWIAYYSDESGQREVYVQPFPDLDGKYPISTAGGTSPVWGPEGRELFYRDGQDGQAVLVVPIDTEGGFAAGTPEVLFEGPYLPEIPNGRQYDLAPDGQRFLMVKEGAATGDTSTPSQIIVIENWFEELKARVPLP